MASILWRGSFRGYGGYAEFSRELVSRLSGNGWDIFIDSLDSVEETSEDFTRWIKSLSSKCVTPDIVVQCCPPPLFISGFGVPSIGVTMFECRKLSSMYAQHCNLVNRVIVPSQQDVSAFKEAGVGKHVKCIRGGVSTLRFRPDGVRLDYRDNPSQYVFGSVGSWTPRKGFDILIRSYTRAFTSKDNVKLVILSRFGPTEFNGGYGQIFSDIDEWRESDAAIYVIQEKLTLDNMPSLYRGFDCFALATRGEGWCMPAAEAMASGLPAVITSGTAADEFVDGDVAYPVDGGPWRPMEYVTNGTDIYKNCEFREPSVVDFSSTLRHVYDNRVEARMRGARAAKRMVSEFSWADVAKEYGEYFNRYCLPKKGQGNSARKPVVDVGGLSTRVHTRRRYK